MKKIVTSICILSIVCSALFPSVAYTQSVLDPNDPVITYDSTKPPTQPPFGEIGKWVRTVRMNWNTDMYKAYIYNGLAFRLHFPKTYNPNAIDGKKYPIMIFFHGHGEYGPIYDNEFHLLLGHQGFDQAIKDGTYDGYILSAQSTGFFGSWDYVNIMNIIKYMIQNNKVDPFHIVAHGLSQGGMATWDILNNFPTYIAAAIPMSWSNSDYGQPAYVNTVKYTPIWNSQGGQDLNPPPATAFQVENAMKAAGANFRLSYYPELGHATWYNMWAEKDFWPFINRAYSSNPWMIGGSTYFWPGESINKIIGIVPGFSAYEWRKDGIVINGANKNTLAVTASGVYDARVQRDGVWSEWSHTPVVINPGRIEAEDFSSMSGVSTEQTLDNGGGLDVGWIEQGDWMDYTIMPPSSGTYSLQFRLASPNTGGKILVKRTDGTLLASVNVPLTGGWQTWQTTSVSIPLSAGEQTLRLESGSSNSWNINWIQFTSGTSAPANQPPVAKAGADQTITLPVNSTTLSGGGTDADGSIVSYQWTKISGGSAAIASPSSAGTSVSSLAQGTYVFRLTVTDDKGATGSDDLTVTVNPQPTSGGGTSTSRIEAENWNSMSGVLTEKTQDVDGNLNVGWIEKGDWMDYSVSVPTTGSYTLKLRLATPYYGAKLQVKNSSGTVLATVDVPITGGFQTWQTTSITVNLSAGTQILRLQSISDAGWNINWLEFNFGTNAPATFRSSNLTSAIKEEVGFNLFPNPATTQITVRLNNEVMGKLIIKLYGANGVLEQKYEDVKTSEIYQKTITTSSLAPGQHLIVAEGENFRQVAKFIKH